MGMDAKTAAAKIDGGLDALLFRFVRKSKASRPSSIFTFWIFSGNVKIEGGLFGMNPRWVRNVKIEESIGSRTEVFLSKVPGFARFPFETRKKVGKMT